MQELLRSYLADHGYLILFLWTFIEGEAGLILAGFLAWQGYFSLPLVMLTAWVGAFLGDQFYFYVGRYKGDILFRLFRNFAVKFRKGLRLIERYGSWVAFVSRYTYGFRIVLPIVLGMTPFPSGRFFWLNLASALSWSIVFSLAGYLFGTSASLFLDDVSRYEHYLLMTLAGIIFTIWVWHYLNLRRQRRPALVRLMRMKQRRGDR